MNELPNVFIWSNEDQCLGWILSSTSCFGVLHMLLKAHDKDDVIEIYIIYLVYNYYTTTLLPHAFNCTWNMPSQEVNKQTTLP